MRAANLDSVMQKTAWVAVRVQRGFISDIRAYKEKAAAQTQERLWRKSMNPDYDDTAVREVRLI